MESQLVPALRFNEFKEDWEITTLGKLMSFKNGVNATKEQYGSGYKFINVLDIINNKIITHEKIIGSVNISEKEFEKNIVESGDILFQRSSETRQEVGQSNVYLDNNKPSTFGGFVIRGKKVNEYDSLYIHYLLKTTKARIEITSKSGGSTRYNVGQETLSNVIIVKSIKLAEQHKIAVYLSSIDLKINLLEEKKSELSRYKKAMMQKLFSQEIRFKDENGKDFPDWEEKSLAQLSAKPKYGLNSSAKPYDGINGYLRITDIDELSHRFIPSGITSPESFTNDYLLKEGDLLFARTGASTGKSYLYRKADGNLYFAGFLIKFSLDSNNSREFIFYQTLLVSYKKWVKIMSMRSGQPGINAEEYSTLPISLPSLPEQQKIADFLSAIDHIINNLGEKIQQTQAFKKAMLQQMFV